MNLEKFTIKAQTTLTDAQQLVLEQGQQQLEVEHVLKVLLEDSQGVNIGQRRIQHALPQILKLPQGLGHQREVGPHLHQLGQ